MSLERDAKRWKGVRLFGTNYRGFDVYRDPDTLVGLNWVARREDVVIRSASESSARHDVDRYLRAENLGAPAKSGDFLTFVRCGAVVTLTPEKIGDRFTLRFRDGSISRCQVSRHDIGELIRQGHVVMHPAGSIVADGLVSTDTLGDVDD